MECKVQCNGSIEDFRNSESHRNILHEHPLFNAPKQPARITKFKLYTHFQDLKNNQTDKLQLGVQMAASTKTIHKVYIQTYSTGPDRGDVICLGATIMIITIHIIVYVYVNMD